jgi:hypothetical protein
MGRWLLLELERPQQEAPAQAAAAEAFVLCVPAAARGHYLAATTHRVRALRCVVTPCCSAVSILISP